ncbi:hypothetical protein M0L20_13725 [Spirosoma sp. RP8]|uniref:Uncharacterized protein n=1 Tax=Spirosoma liriopis TaxID=2937440 RepID=A0ABT0HM35_9BACT|nr:hypothetical protein [Spirosoma liriopis]MCK8492922.1 hypothetical protein [Spirosoma liriopis]
MSPSNKNKVVNYLLTQMTYILLAESPNKDAIGKAAERHQARLKAELSKEEFEPIGVMRDTIVQLAYKLANCETVTELQKTHAYIQALNDGEVMIAVPDLQTGDITHYEPNGSPNLDVS